MPYHDTAASRSGASMHKCRAGTELQRRQSIGCPVLLFFFNSAGVKQSLSIIILLHEYLQFALAALFIYTASAAPLANERRAVVLRFCLSSVCVIRLTISSYNLLLHKARISGDLCNICVDGRLCCHLANASKTVKISVTRIKNKCFWKQTRNISLIESVS